MGLSGPKGYCPMSNNKKELEKGHLYKMNVIKRNNRKFMIDKYNERQNKIKELESLLADLKKEQNHEEFLKSLLPILKEKVRIYRGKDLEKCLKFNELKQLNKLSGNLRLLDNFFRINVLEY